MTTDKRLKDAEFNLEVGTDTPNVRLILRELEDAQQPASDYLARNLKAHNSWHSRWPGQCIDGRKHPLAGEEVFPWPGASDSRLRSVKQQIRDHVMVGKAGVRGCRIQAQSVRPLAPGHSRFSNQVTKLLQWQTGTQLRNELQREIPLALSWRFGYGAAALSVGWWQCRRLEYHELTIPILADIVSAQTGLQPGEALFQVQEGLSNPAQFEQMAQYLQTLSLIVTKRQARKAVEDLQQLRTTKLPIPYTFQSQPRITALRPGVDLLFRDLTGDLQAEPWIAWREMVSETDLYDLIETDNYDPRFVEEAVSQKGERNDDIWLLQTLAERGLYGDHLARPAWVNAYQNSIELIHFWYKAHVKGVPIVFRTILNPRVLGRDLKNPLYASHGPHPYDHGQYPLVAMRHEKEERGILSSQGIAELAYTWEQEEKIQADGLADRTAIAHRPPLIVPYSKVHAIQGSPLPGAVLGVTRPQEIQWMPIPPGDDTPVQVLQAIARRVERFFPLFGAELDPDLKNMYRQEVVDGPLQEIEAVLEMMFQLDQQYLPEDEVADVAGGLQMPFHVSRKEIQGAHNIRVKFDAKTIDVEYVKEKVGLMGLLLPFNQGGTANMNAFFRSAMELVDPDMADDVIENDQVATDRERQDEKQAIAQMLVGLEPDKPAQANNQLRLQVIQEALAMPGMKEKVTGNEVTQALFKNRIAFFMNQIQQYQKNPQIGREVSTKTFSNDAPSMTQLPG
jgi:hypothetical protein